MVIGLICRLKTTGAKGGDDTFRAWILKQARFCSGEQRDYKTNDGAKATGSANYFFSKLAKTAQI